MKRALSAIILLVLPVIAPIPGNADATKDDIVGVFRKYIELNTELINSVREDSRTDDHQSESRSKAESYAENVFNPILKKAKRKVCIDKDARILNEFYRVILKTTNSADEYPSFVLGEMFICNPDLFVDQFQKFGIEDQQTIYDSLEWGFRNVTWKNEHNIPDYKKLLDILTVLEYNLQ